MARNLTRRQFGNNRHPKMKVFVLLAIVCSIWTASAIPQHRSLREDECKATITNVAYDKDHKQIVTTFTPADGCTAQKYQVNCKIGTKEPIREDTIPFGNVGIIILEDEIFCEDVEIIIVAIDDNGLDIVESDPHSIARSLPDITISNIMQTETQLVVSYDEIDAHFDSAECATVFTVEFTEKASRRTKSGVNCQNGGCALDIADLETLNTCTSYTATIKIQAKNYDPKTITSDFYFKLQPIDEPEVKTTNNEISIIFKPLVLTTEDAACGPLNYKVIETPDSCYKSIFNVVTTFDDNDKKENGIGREIVVQKNPTAVEDLVADVSGDNVYLTWNPPSGGNKCGLTYFGTILGDTPKQLFNDVHATSTTIPLSNLELTDCKFKTISVLAKLPATAEGEFGDAATVDIAGDLGTVESLECHIDDDNKVTCIWEIPSMCTDEEAVEYNVMYYNGNEIKSDRVKETKYKNIECGSDLWFTVTPVLGVNGVGNIAETAIPACTA